jgi:hypothetical protein
LVGGYYVVTRLERFKYLNQRLSGQHIVFNAIIAGVPLLVISLLISGGLTYFFEDKVSWVKSFFPIKDQYFGTCVLSFFLAVVGTGFSNRFIDETESIYRSIVRIGNELELLFAESCLYNELIQITLKSDKVYIGWVGVLPEPSQCLYIQLIPLLSGYRDDKKELIITTDYSQVYSEYIRKGQIKNIDELEMNLVLPVNEIVSASRFDFDIFERFQSMKNTSAP